MAYYNSRLALWEPLIEPEEQLQDGRLLHCPWELRADVSLLNVLHIKLIKNLFCVTNFAFQ
jgi:vacuolar protein sorting-associated protein 13A/C